MLRGLLVRRRMGRKVRKSTPLLWLLCISLLVVVFLYYGYSYYFTADGTTNRSVKSEEQQLEEEDDNTEGEMPCFASHTTNTTTNRTHDITTLLALRHIRKNVRKTWQQYKYLVVLGIPSMDAPPQRRRRALQRASWLRYREVATRANGFKAPLLVLFALARPPPLVSLTPLTPQSALARGRRVYSMAAHAEAASRQDVLLFPQCDAAAKTRKHSGGGGHWGLAAEVGTSAKSFMWYRLALRLAPNAAYIAKADDDIFLRVPQYLADLNTLPRDGLYWGRIMPWWPRKGNKQQVFYFAGGMCITMSRDVVQHVIEYTPLQRILSTPVDEESLGEGKTKNATLIAYFKSLNADHEDIMIGRVLYETKHPGIIFVPEKKCRFHDVHVGANKAPITAQSVVVHHLRENEYAELLRRFPEEGNDSENKVKPVLFTRIPGPMGVVGEAQYVYSCR
ncbi:UDP-Gal or UDP-GlcNAc-dependent glycosyltransferase [Trypanosoma theileri]|uniref:Hexosyltransferase n=1 Tax=Trypanosoma theileri TaxID=67003 RepID=A0A1X0NVK8_9TRYP|nr:UDP-Gal or UDP-GlcNAc-dependent glycosyltransferase [Trypanosoma theileri]ORC88717.1 UDP-Gal or UDP-GlcNAc-dependent glycosyltransferase [Trypanosoma theileri]